MTNKTAKLSRSPQTGCRLGSKRRRGSLPGLRRDAPRADSFCGISAAGQHHGDIGSPLAEQAAYPGAASAVSSLHAGELGLIVDPAILFPPTYPYTSGTTKILRENFAELASEIANIYPLSLMIC